MREKGGQYSYEAPKQRFLLLDFTQVIFDLERIQQKVSKLAPLANNDRLRFDFEKLREAAKEAHETFARHREDIERSPDGPSWIVIPFDDVDTLAETMERLDAAATEIRSEFLRHRMQVGIGDVDNLNIYLNNAKKLFRKQ